MPRPPIVCVKRLRLNKKPINWLRAVSRCQAISPVNNRDNPHSRVPRNKPRRHSRNHRPDRDNKDSRDKGKEGDKEKVNRGRVSLKDSLDRAKPKDRDRANRLRPVKDSRPGQGSKVNRKGRGKASRKDKVAARGKRRAKAKEHLHPPMVK